MAPNSRIILVRHGQAYHNVDMDWSISDPPLTPLGTRQAASMAAKIADLQEQVDLIITSPLTRTLQTTLNTWGPAISRLGIQNVICLPEAQECCDFNCDIGSSREHLERQTEFSGFDFARLTSDWNSKTGFWAPDSKSIENRVQWVRDFVRDRPEKTIVLVAHGDFLRAITRGSHMWRFVEMQLFSFDEATVGGSECLIRFEKAIQPGYSRLDPDVDAAENANQKL